MPDNHANHPLLRTRTGKHAPVGNVELFFDLIFVFAVTQLSHGLLEHPTPMGLLQTAILLGAVWWGWIDTAWATNWLDVDKPLVRGLLRGRLAPLAPEYAAEPGGGAYRVRVSGSS